jgi:hypothetical protein
MSEITRKQVCKCEHCGNEAEMVLTCTLPEAPGGQAPAAPSAAGHRHVKAHGTCTHCGNEADMWIDL